MIRLCNYVITHREEVLNTHLFLNEVSTELLPHIYYNALKRVSRPAFPAPLPSSHSLSVDVNTRPGGARANTSSSCLQEVSDTSIGQRIKKLIPNKFTPQPNFFIVIAG